VGHFEWGREEEGMVKERVYQVNGYTALLEHHSAAGTHTL